MLAVAERVKSSMLVANAWHARSDAASSLVVSLGIVGNVMGYRLLDPVAALIVGLLVTKMGLYLIRETAHGRPLPAAHRQGAAVSGRPEADQHAGFGTVTVSTVQQSFNVLVAAGKSSAEPAGRRPRRGA